MSASGDLFGERPKPAAGPKVRRELLVDEMVSTRLAWRLAWPGDKPDWKWAPKALVERGRGQDAKFFTMPKSIAQERGWL